MNVLKRLLTLMAVVLAMTLSSAQASLTSLDVSNPDTTSGVQTAFAGGTFIVTQETQSPSGTGVFEPFLRVQANGSEQGFNTDQVPTLDAKAGIWTHSIQLGAIPIVTIGGIDYRQLALDVNQAGGQTAQISLNQVQLFSSSTDLGLSTNTLQQANASPNQSAVISFADGTLLFQMSGRDTGTQTAYTVIAATQSGSGVADMFLYVNNSVFSSTSPTSFLTMFTQLGDPNGFPASTDGFEEWGVRTTTPTAVPEPSTMAIAGLGALGFVGFGLRRRLKK